MRRLPPLASKINLKRKKKEKKGKITLHLRKSTNELHV